MGRSPCCDDNGLKKGPWTAEEDQKLIDFINKKGHGSWRTLPKQAGLNRCGKSCRLRWTNYLRPDIKRGKFSEEEERMILHLHSVLGNKWSKIATHLPGRTDNEIKNFWNTHLRKKLLNMGLDPNTHKPRTDINLLMNLSRMLSMVPSNFGNLLNPNWDNAPRLQTDATQLAKIQLVQNLLQVISSTNPLPNIEESSNNLLGLSHMLTPFEGLVNGTNTFYGNTNQVTHPEFANTNALTSQLPCDGYQAFPNSWPGFEGGFSYEIRNKVNKNSLSNSYSDTETEKAIPALVSISPESSSANYQMQSKISPTDYISNQSPTSSMLDTWAGLLGDEGSDSYWKDILDSTSSPPSPMPW